MIVTADRVLAQGRAYAPGWLQLDGSRVGALGSGPLPVQAGPGPRYDLGPVTLVPGFVDVHAHGGGGAEFGGTAEEIRRVAAFHLRHGTTTVLSSLASAGPDVLLAQVGRLAEAVQAGTVAGIHLEGPWLSPLRRGAHAAEWLRPPDRAELNRLIAAGRGTVSMITVAPELPGALDLIRAAVDLGVTVAIGHTDADHATTMKAFDAGARVATHLFNAMRPIHHREPGPVLAALEDERVVVELVLDGLHLHRSVYRHVLSTAGPDRVLLVTDAMAAAGMPDGRYHLGGSAVTVRHGAAVLARGPDERDDTGVPRAGRAEVIAGSTATADALFARAVDWGHGIAGGAAESVVAMSSTNGARLLGRTINDLSTGSAADLVVLGPDLRTRAVLRAGCWIDSPPAALTATGERPPAAGAAPDASY